MALFKQKIDAPVADEIAFSPSANVPASTVQEAIQYVMDNATGSSGTVYAPTDAQYLVSASTGALSNERTISDGVGIVWDFTGTGTAVANLSFLGFESLSDPGADRGMFWDDSAGAIGWFTPAGGLSFVGTNLSITNQNLVDVRDASFAAGDLLTYSGSAITSLAKGNNYEWLRVNGFGALEWVAFPAGSGTGDLMSFNNLSDVSDAAVSRQNLGVEIGVDVQPHSANLDGWSALAQSSKQDADATLTALSGVVTAANKLVYATGVDSFSTSDLTAFARTILDDADAATVRGTLGLVIGTNVQAYDAELAALAGLTSAADSAPYFTGSGTAALMTVTAAARTVLDDTTVGAMLTTLGGQPLDAELTAIAGLTSAADRLPYFTGSGTAALATFTAAGRALVDDADAAAQRTTLGLVIGTDVQAFDAELAAIAGLTSAADRLPYFTGSGTAALATFTTFGRSLVDDADAATARTTLGLVIGTDVQAFDAELAAIAGLTSAADRLPYFTGSGTAALATFTTFGRSLVDDADALTARTTLGVAIGSNVQAWDTDLDAIAALAPTNDDVIQRKAGAWTNRTMAQLIADLAALGTTFQPLDSDLTAIAALSTNSAGRSILVLTDPNADRIAFWDDSAGAYAHLSPTNGIEISNTDVQMTSNQRTGCITYVIDGGGSAITTGIKGDFSVPAACTITSYTALADQTGSIVVDIWKDTYANFPPTDADSITSAAPVTISSATKATDSTLTGWTTSISAGDILRFNVDSASTITRLTIELRVTKS